MNRDPICGKEVDAATPYQSEYNGQTYYFCSAACQEQFEQHPERFSVGRAA